MNNTAILLGAGSSVTAGFPSTKKLTETCNVPDVSKAY